jgi:acyl carrier protein
MDRNEVLKKTIEVCLDVFGNDELVLDENSCSANVEEWDSLAHLSIISDLEDEFDISFSLDEMTNIRNLGELADAVMRKIQG